MKILATILMLLLPLSATAGVSYNKEEKVVTLFGSTTSSQWVLLNNILAANEVRGLKMFGPGGDYYAGLALGRLINKHDLTVTIPEDLKCVSACAFAVLGSPKVYIDGQILIHRGFFKYVPTMSTLDEFARRNSIGHHDGTKYLIEVGFTFNFAKAVIADTSPCKFLVIEDSKFLEQLRSEDPFDITPSLAMPKVDNCG